MNDLMIAGRVVRRMDGLYCLNDLHKASGGSEKHRPLQWLRLDQTVELINELENEADAQISATRKNQEVIKKIQGFGKQQGTYACRELVYAYATWISPRFFLTVLRVFDASLNGGREAAGMRPALLPLRAPRDVEEARALALETLREVNILSQRLAKVEPWLCYWRDVFLDELSAPPHAH